MCSLLKKHLFEQVQWMLCKAQSKLTVFSINFIKYTLDFKVCRSPLFSETYSVLFTSAWVGEKRQCDLKWLYSYDRVTKNQTFFRRKIDTKRFTLYP